MPPLPRLQRRMRLRRAVGHLIRSGRPGLHRVPRAARPGRRQEPRGEGVGMATDPTPQTPARASRKLIAEARTRYALAAAEHENQQTEDSLRNRLRDLVELAKARA